ncbi:sarcosine oxidase subunit gamma [Roseobacter sp. YSTF-M11]|uniref:Sarcosine oxidase subunit gamma n=1 Tax=Roseobacter insulae TaxID=2859783 RepID=A0A9X1K2M5_9RHOB|nr:sarcosine oxidase subunit gamma family protein [Roseobacter insulae]MBW4707727.1 sarcosine oxidase subunit gamma [Roseobacter insulae]
MSDPVTALNGVSSDSGIATITGVPLQGMITLRGDLSAAAVKNAATGVAAVDMPGQGEANCVENRGICWMSPDELLVLCPYETVAANIEKMQQTLGIQHALVANVSDARASFRLGGPRAREVLAKLCPVDLSPGAFTPGMFRRTRMAQVPAAFWMRNADTFQIICFRSQARYVFDLLKISAQPGSEVHLYHA